MFGLSHLGSIHEFWNVVGELSVDNIRAQAERPVHIVVLGRQGAGKSSLIQTLLGEEGIASEMLSEIEIVSLPLPDQPPADLYVYVVSANAEIEPSALQALQRYRRPVLVAVTHRDHVIDVGDFERRARAIFGDEYQDKVAFGSAISAEDARNVFGPAIIRSLPDERLSLARRFPSLRSAAGNALLAEAARVNAEFAFASDLPAAIPLLGGILAGAADFLVLTKNQALLVFKLAAIHGRDLRSKAPLVAEIAPVVGAAFFWRSIARTLVGILPPIVSAVPKTTIAYVGTYVVGKMAQYYYANDLRPSPKMVERFTKEALDGFKETTARLKSMARRER